MSDVQIRYGRTEDGKPKNTLVTVKEEGHIFFGISRCRLNADKPMKAEGFSIAAFRAGVAMDTPWNAHHRDGSLEVCKSGMFGVVSVDEKGKLLDYFRGIDTIMLERSRKR